MASDGSPDAINGPFVSGAARYLDGHPEILEPLPRIYLQFRPEGASIDFLGLLDTGGHFFILSRQVAEAIADHLGEKIDERSLLTARGRIHGDLYRHNIELIAEIGESLAIEATVLIADEWNGPSIIGYHGVLDRIHLAIQPEDSFVFFGPLFNPDLL